MSKESGGFFRKVAKFVANPTTDWAELDRARTSPGESEFAKSEIKAMIERKRRNDFVRKRELDMLRKIRREGLTPDAALALGSPSNLDPESSPHAGARSDMAVKAKIDAIEQQMVGVVTRQPVETPAARPSVQPIRLHDMPSPPDAITSPATLPYEDTAPEISQAVLDAARGALPGASGARPASVPTLQAALDVIEVMHDPELDEAVIAFANADFDQCERGLMALVQPGAARHDHLDTWMVLFDLYRALDLPQKFEQLAVAFLQKFGVSPPQWYSLPDKVSRFLGQGERPPRTLRRSAARGCTCRRRGDAGRLARACRAGHGRHGRVTHCLSAAAPSLDHVMGPRPGHPPRGGRHAGPDHEPMGQRWSATGLARHRGPARPPGRAQPHRFA